jgi:ribonuclease Z
MRITFLGTGGSIPSVNRSLPATALQYESEVLLFDCGEGTQRQFMMSSFSFMKVDKVFITHFHGDHFLGLPGLIQSMSFNGREEPLYIYGPEGLPDLVDRLVHLGYFAQRFDIYAKEMKHEETVEFDAYAVRAVEVDHSIPALGYVFEEKERRGRFMVERARQLGVPEGPNYRRLQQGETIWVGGKTISPNQVVGPPRKGRKVVFSGDTRPCSSLLHTASEADVLVHEATVDSSLSDKAREFGHSTAEEAAMLAKKAGVRLLYLNHISNRYDDVLEIQREAALVFPGVQVAEDLMEVEVRRQD